jgi:hypothetical protein
MNRRELAMTGHIGIAGGARGREAANCAVLVDSNRRHRLARIRAAERVT